MKKYLFFFVLMLSILACANSKENVKKLYEKYSNGNYEAVTNEEAMEILKNAYSVDDEVTGDGGSVSLQRYSYKKIRKSKDLLTELFNEAKTNEGKVYALMGLSSLDRELYKKYYEQIDPEITIKRLQGCLMMSAKIGDYLKFDTVFLNYDDEFLDIGAE